MTIEFVCEHCGKALSTSDDKAGRKAKCPGCGEPVLVPNPSGLTPSVTDADEDDFELPAAPQPKSGKKSVFCAMCGAKVPPGETSCLACGEPLDEDATADSFEREPTKMEVGDVVSSSWNVFKMEMGLVIGTVIVVFLLNIAAGLPSQILSIVGGLMQQQGEPEVGALLAMAPLLLFPLVYAAQWYLQLGQAIVLLRIARGEETSIGDIFSGGKYFWRMIGSSLVVMIFIVLGMLACIIPGIILALMFWPYYFVLIDEDSGGIDCLWKAREYTNGNKLSTFVLGIVAMGINLLGLLALGVGLIFTMPLTALIMAVAYCRMTGQRVACD
ncbi:DUF975 family protein [bacterium]|nr:DUF975 family protein [bacterium]